MLLKLLRGIGEQLASLSLHEDQVLFSTSACQTFQKQGVCSPVMSLSLLDLQCKYLDSFALGEFGQQPLTCIMMLPHLFAQLGEDVCQIGAALLCVGALWAQLLLAMLHLLL